MTELPPEGPASPILEEAAKLATAVQEWARKNLPPPATRSSAGGPPGDAAGDPRTECQWCPLCQFAAVLRGERPEVNEKLAEAGNAIVGALRSLLDAGPSGAHRHPGPSEPRVQHIDLSDPTEE